MVEVVSKSSSRRQKNESFSLSLHHHEGTAMPRELVETEPVEGAPAFRRPNVMQTVPRPASHFLHVQTGVPDTQMTREATGLLREFNRRLAQDAAARVAGAGAADVGTRLGHIRAAIYDAWREAGPGHVRMAEEFVRAAPSNDPHSAHPELLGIIVDIIAAAVDAGELTDGVPVDLAASLALIQLIAPMSYVLAGQDVDVDRLSVLLLDQWLRGMGVTKPRSAPKRGR